MGSVYGQISHIRIMRSASVGGGVKKKRVTLMVALAMIDLYVIVLHAIGVNWQGYQLYSFFFKKTMFFLSCWI